MFGIGGFELFLILVFAFLIFGPDKLPDIARTIGKAIGRFRSAQEEMNEVIKPTDIYDPNDKEQPFKDPTIALDKLAKHQEEKRAGKKAESSDSGKDAEASSAAPASSSTANASGESKAESFSERKARYERERAARKAAEEEAAKAAEENKDASGDATATDETEGSTNDATASASKGGEQ